MVPALVYVDAFGKECGIWPPGFSDLYLNPKPWLIFKKRAVWPQGGVKAIPRLTGSRGYQFKGIAQGVAVKRS